MWSFNKLRESSESKVKSVTEEAKRNIAIDNIEARVKQLECSHDNAEIYAISGSSYSSVGTNSGTVTFKDSYVLKCPDCEKFIRESNKGEYLRSKYDQAKKELNEYYESKVKIKADDDTYSVRETIPKQL